MSKCLPGNIGSLFNHLRIPPWVLPLKLFGFIRCVLTSNNGRLPRCKSLKYRQMILDGV